MLTRLSLGNYALVETLDLDPGKGLCLLTGETGAGKSILVGAVALLAGGRAETEMVREGASHTVVEGTFEPTRHEKTVAALLRGWAIPYDGKVIVRRVIHKSGRNVINVNGAAITLAQLRELSTLLVVVHGQSQGRLLLNEDSHRKILDGLPSVAPKADATRRAFLSLERRRSLLRTLRKTKAERARRLDILTFQRQEIDRVNPSPGEDDSLEVEKERLRNAERIAEASGALCSLLSDDDASVSVRLAEGARSLNELSLMDPKWKAFEGELSTAASIVAAIASEAERETATLVFDPQALEATMEKLASLDNLKRKYGPTLEEVLAFREGLEKEYEALSSDDTSEEEAEKGLTAAFGEYLERASELYQARKEAARSLSSSVNKALKPLAMEKARFSVQVVSRRVTTASEATATGNEEVRFLFSANDGEPLKALSKIASGGELSRTLLALLTTADPAAAPDTFVFDEVDAGIGGMPAERVGRSLRKLAASHQVLCVTHLPQVAAFSHWHARVRKETAGGRTTIRVEALSEASRTNEIARMVAGERVGPSALRHAKALITAAKECKI